MKSLDVNGFRDEGDNRFRLITNPYIKYYEIKFNNVSQFLKLQVHRINFMYGIIEHDILMDAEMRYSDFQTTKLSQQIYGNPMLEEQDYFNHYLNTYWMNTTDPLLTFGQLYSNIVATFLDFDCFKHHFINDRVIFNPNEFFRDS